ncbi:MAG: LytTR family transcriptional regulator DNA-binding domain-containing protein [Oscillospiraceae bacterium]|nr:LytTR family transcriptional regulator DNA-binding domain-containing protein [Oscillospiraceae bacterium]
MEYSPSLALWDDKPKRALILKNLLDMFAPEDKETTLLPNELLPPIENHDVVFLSFDECDEAALSAARSVRISNDMTYLMLIGDKNSNFQPFFKPKIRPSGVLFHPLQTPILRESLEEIAEEFQRLTQSENDEMYVLKSEGVTYRIAYRDILFFEADNKQIMLHTSGQAIRYYESMENLATVLPGYFIRCHRGYIVNIRKVEEVRSAEMELRLSGGYRIPFSRSKRSAVSDALSLKGQASADVN